jgi:hypothetical protein
MRGSPLARALIIFAVLLCVAPALWQMTSADATAAHPVPRLVATEEKDLPIELAFTVAPARVVISHLGKPVWEKAQPEATEELSLHVPWPSEGGELKFSIEWPEGSPLAAMRARLTDPARGQIERSLWGRGPKTGVLGFP